MKMANRAIVKMTLALIAVASFAPFSAKQLNAEVKKNLTKVEVIRVTRQKLDTYGSYVGHLTPNRRVTVSSEIAGTITKADFYVGDRVKKGQALVKLDTERLKLNRDLMKSNYNLALMDYSRENRLYAKNLSTSAKLATLKNRLEVAKISLDMAELDLQKSAVKAPLSGVVNSKLVEKGEYIGLGKNIAEILEISSVLAKVDIPEQEIQYIKKGKEVTAMFDALPGRQFTGIISSIGFEADSRSRSFPIEVTIHNPESLLLPGMLVRATVLKSSLEGQVMIPRHVVQEDEKGSFVYVANSTTVKKKYIETGISQKNQVQVVTGLKSGEFVIETGQQLVVVGDSVDIVKIKE